jgi:hypothetical protein
VSQTDGATGTTDDRRSDDSTGDGFWDFGVITTLVAVGLALVVFPEPATTVTGVLMLTVGLSLAVLNALA